MFNAMISVPTIPYSTIISDEGASIFRVVSIWGTVQYSTLFANSR